MPWKKSPVSVLVLAAIMLIDMVLICKLNFVSHPGRKTVELMQKVAIDMILIQILFLSSPLLITHS
jgi:hypothetical protein